MPAKSGLRALREEGQPSSYACHLQNQPKLPRRQQTSSACQHPGNDGFPFGSGFVLDFFEQGGLKIVRVGMHFALGGFFVSGAIEAKITDCQIIFLFIHYWRPEGAANHWTEFVNFTMACFRM